MIFTTKAEYGVRLMVELGRQGAEAPTSLKAIAAAEGLPLAYLERIVALLKKAGLVESTRGAHGGYRLARHAEDVRMDEVILALEGAVAPMTCFVDDTDGVRGRARPVQPRGVVRPRLRHEAPVDARPGRRHGEAGPDDARRARRLLRAVREPRPRVTHLPDAYRRGLPAMPDLEIRNLHVQADDKPILKGLDLTVRRRGPRAHGPQRLGQVDPGQRDHGPPRASR